MRRLAQRRHLDSARSKPVFRPHVEHLETRLAPAIDLVLDMNLRRDGNDGVADVIELHRPGRSLEIVINDGTPIVYDWADIHSLTILG